VKEKFPFPREATMLVSQDHIDELNKLRDNLTGITTACIEDHKMRLAASTNEKEKGLLSATIPVLRVLIRMAGCYIEEVDKRRTAENYAAARDYLLTSITKVNALLAALVQDDLDKATKKPTLMN
jgi:hypothetical protein